MRRLTILLGDKLFLLALLLLGTSCTIDSLQPYPCPIRLKLIGEDGIPVDVEMQKNGSQYVFVPLGFDEGDGKSRPTVENPDEELGKLIEEQYVLSIGLQKVEPDENSEQKKATGTNIDIPELKGLNSLEKCFNQTPLKQKGQSFNASSELENSKRLLNKDGSDFSKDSGPSATTEDEFHLLPEYFNETTLTEPKANDENTLGETTESHMSSNEVLTNNSQPKAESLPQPLTGDIMTLTTQRSSDVLQISNQPRFMAREQFLRGSSLQEPEYNKTTEGQYVALLEILKWKRLKDGKLSLPNSYRDNNLQFVTDSSTLIEQAGTDKPVNNKSSQILHGEFERINADPLNNKNEISDDSNSIQQNVLHGEHSVTNQNSFDSNFPNATDGQFQGSLNKSIQSSPEKQEILKSSTPNNLDKLNTGKPEQLMQMNLNNKTLLSSSINGLQESYNQSTSQNSSTTPETRDGFILKPSSNNSIERSEFNRTDQTETKSDLSTLNQTTSDSLEKKISTTEPNYARENTTLLSNSTTGLKESYNQSISPNPEDGSILKQTNNGSIESLDFNHNLNNQIETKSNVPTPNVNASDVVGGFHINSNQSNTTMEQNSGDILNANNFHANNTNGTRNIEKESIGYQFNQSNLDSFQNETEKIHTELPVHTSNNSDLNSTNTESRSNVSNATQIGLENKTPSTNSQKVGNESQNFQPNNSGNLWNLESENKVSVPLQSNQEGRGIPDFIQRDPELFRTFQLFMQSTETNTQGYNDNLKQDNNNLTQNHMNNAENVSNVQSAGLKESMKIENTWEGNPIRYDYEDKQPSEQNSRQFISSSNNQPPTIYNDPSKIESRKEPNLVKSEKMNDTQNVELREFKGSWTATTTASIMTDTNPHSQGPNNYIKTPMESSKTYYSPNPYNNNVSDVSVIAIASDTSPTINQEVRGTVRTSTVSPPSIKISKIVEQSRGTPSYNSPLPIEPNRHNPYQSGRSAKSGKMLPVLRGRKVIQISKRKDLSNFDPKVMKVTNSFVVLSRGKPINITFITESSQIKGRSIASSRKARLFKAKPSGRSFSSNNLENNLSCLSFEVISQRQAAVSSIYRKPLESCPSDYPCKTHKSCLEWTFGLLGKDFQIDHRKSNSYLIELFKGLDLNKLRNIRMDFQNCIVRHGLTLPFVETVESQDLGRINKASADCDSRLEHFRECFTLAYSQGTC